MQLAPEESAVADDLEVLELHLGAGDVRFSNAFLDLLN